MSARVMEMMDCLGESLNQKSDKLEMLSEQVNQQEEYVDEMNNEISYFLQKCSRLPTANHNDRNNFAHMISIVQNLEDLSDENTLVFGHKSKYYSFADMHWVNLSVTLTDGLFSSISFYTPRDSKADAMKDFKDIVANLSKKYQLTDVVPDDTTVYVIKRAYSKSPYVAGVGCYSYSDQDSVTCYTTSLDFTDTKIYD